jgi:chromosome segregation ATPase
MRAILFAFLLLMLVISPSLSDEDVPAKIRALETELSHIRGESTDIPAEEINKASHWIEDAKGSLSSGDSERTNIILQKASYQIELLNALAKEIKSKREIDEMKESLQKIRNQTEEIKATDVQVIEEINKLEQK